MTSLDEMVKTTTENTDEMEDLEKNMVTMDDDSYLALVSKSYRNLMNAYHDWAESLHEEENSCTSSDPCHQILSILFIVGTTVTMGCALFATVSKLLEEGNLLHYRIIVNGGTNMHLDEVFSLASKVELKSLVLSLWYNNLVIEFFALWTFAIVRSTNTKAIPFTFKLVAYCSCIPLVVAFQWAADTSILYMYLDYITDGYVKQGKLMTLLWYIFQIASWSMQCVCLLVVVVSIGGQLLFICRSRKRRCQ